MSDYIENTNYLSKEDIVKGLVGSLIHINRSTELDELASKLTDEALAKASTTYLPHAGKHKARMSDLVNLVGLLFTLIKVDDDKPVFLVMREWDWRNVSAFYFMAGIHNEIKQKLTELCEDSQNLVENSRWH